MTNRPNILLLMTDQQRYDSLGCYGLAAANTPNLDRLASEGALFERAYVTNPVCTPSRASLMTGKHLPGHGVYRLCDNMPHDAVMFTRRLQELGYQTALFGKLHVSSMDFEVNHRHPNDGFDVFELCGEGCGRMDTPLQAYSKWLRETDPEFHERLRREKRKLLHPPRERQMSFWAAQRTIDYINRWDAATDKPFFCKMSLFQPHNPYQHHPAEMSALVDADKLPRPLVVDGEFDGKPAALLREHHQSGMGDFDAFSPDQLRQMRHGYHAAVAYGDMEFGRVLDALASRGLDRNTIVIFTSDHGDMLGDHQLLAKGAFFYDPCTRVPLIVRWPERMGPSRIEGLVQLHDIAATVLAAAGMPAERIAQITDDARDLVPIAQGQAPAHEEAVCCYRNSGHARGGVYWDPPIHATMIRSGRWKLNVYHGDELGELYDMQSDPQERNNLWNAPDHAATRLQMTHRLLEWLAAQERRHGSRGGETRKDPTS